MAFLWHDDCGMIVWTMRDTTASDEEASAQVYLVDPKKSSVPSSRALLNLIQMSLFGFFKINLIILQCRFRTRHWTKSTNCSWWILWGEYYSIFFNILTSQFFLKEGEIDRKFMMDWKLKIKLFFAFFYHRFFNFFLFLMLNLEKEKWIFLVVHIFFGQKYSGFKRTHFEN